MRLDRIPVPAGRPAASLRRPDGKNRPAGKGGAVRRVQLAAAAGGGGGGGEAAATAEEEKKLQGAVETVSPPFD